MLKRESIEVPLSSDEYWQSFQSAEVLKYGHFRFASGNHADEKIDFEKVKDFPDVADIAMRGIGALIARDAQINSYRLDAIVSVAQGANHFVDGTAQHASQLLGEEIVAIKTDTVGEKPHRRFCWPDETPPQLLSPSSSVAVLEDVFNKFTNSMSVARLIEKTGAHIVGLYAAVARGTSLSTPNGTPAKFLVRHEIADWSPESCYLCPDTPIESEWEYAEYLAHRADRNPANSNSIT